MKSLLFIKPNLGTYKAHDVLEPIVFAILKALTPEDITCHFVDDRFEEIDFDLKVDAVAISVETFNAKRSYAIAGRFRDRGIQVIMGGFHPTISPDEALEHCDSVVIGDAEGVWKQVIADLRNNSLKMRYCCPEEYSIKNVVPDRSIFEGKKYNPLHIVQYTRGCRFNCSFCSIHAFYKSKLIHRDVNDVKEEFKTLKHRNVFFADDNLFSNKEMVTRLLKEITPLKKKWVAQVSIDVAKDDELLSLMKLSGCIALLIGLESLDRENLKAMNKGWNPKQISYTDAIKKIKKHGIMVIGTFILGTGNDNEETISRTLKFAKEQKLFLAHFNPLTPTPGTKIYEELERDNKLIFDKWWLSDEYSFGTPLFKPQNMSVKSYELEIYRAKTSFNSIGSIMRRSLDFSVFSNPVNLVIYFLANLVTRKEVHSKQKVKIGM